MFPEFQVLKRNNFCMIQMAKHGEAIVLKVWNMPHSEPASNVKKKGMPLTFSASEFWYWTAFSPFQNHHDPDPRRCPARWNDKSSTGVGPTASRPQVGVCCRQSKLDIFCIVFSSGWPLALDLGILQQSMPVQLVIYLHLKFSTRHFSAFSLKSICQTVWWSSFKSVNACEPLFRLYCMDCKICANYLSPNRTSESAMHSASKRTGLAMGCDLQYLDLPMCTGHTDDGTPLIEMKPWPFLLPSNMAWG